MKNNTIVIPLAPSKIGHLDLRFALRSIEKHVSNVKNIVLVGEKPHWAKNVDVIPHSDEADPKWKERNIYRKIQASCLSGLVTDDFFFANDDHVFLESIDATEYPFYFKGTATDSFINNRGSKYRITMSHLRKFLDARAFPDRNYDTHCPIIYNKSKFMDSFSEFDWNSPYGIGIKSVYCAVNRVEGVYMKDCKMVKKMTLSEVRMRCDGRHVISFTDAPLKAGLLEYLEEKFPSKSIYES